MKEVIDFMIKHKDFYLEYLNERIIKKIQYGYTCDVDQIYCHLNLINIKNSAYYNFYQIIKKFFRLNKKKILECASGKIPILGSIIKECEDCIVDCINNEFIFDFYKGTNCIKYNLKNEFDFSDYDLIVAFRPCEVTENIVDNCIKYNKSFILYFCPCELQPNNKNIKTNSAKEWREYIVNKCETSELYDINIIEDDKMQDRMPILIAKIK